MKLGIYEHGQKINEYYCDAYDLTFGTVEDVLGALQLDDIGEFTDAALVKIIIKFVSCNLPLVRELMKDIFTGITAEELRKTHIKEIGKVIVDVVKYAFAEIIKGASSN